MAAFPVSGGREATALPMKRQECRMAATSAATPAVVRSPYTEGRVSLHGDSVPPTRRFGSSYTGNRVSLHGGSGFPTWRSGCILRGTSQIANEVACNHPEGRDWSAL